MINAAAYAILEWVERMAMISKTINWLAHLCGLEELTLVCREMINERVLL